MVVLFGVSVYLGYLYSVESKKQETKIRITGQVLTGATAGLRRDNCTDQYYLVSGDRMTWLITVADSRKSRAAISIPKYKYMEVEVTGVKSDGNGPCGNPNLADCGCEDYLIVDDVKIVKGALPSQQEYVGDVACLGDADEDAPLATCQGRIGLFIADPSNTIEGGVTYELRGNVGTGYVEKERVRVLGELTLGTSTVGWGGIIDVFEISRAD